MDMIVKGHGGDISVDSHHLGGSIFTVNLPLMAPPAISWCVGPHPL